MQSPIAVAYVAFAFLVVMTLVGVWFVYRLFRLRCYYSTNLYNHIFKIYYFLAASFILFSYFTIGTTLLILTTINGQAWAEWSWRWPVGGALLDVRIFREI
jgi:hypothetical protein